MSLLNLPSDNILEFALFLPLHEISHLCQTSSRFNRLICNNNYFWKLKFIKDFGEISYTGDWRYLYQNHMNLWATGDNGSVQLGLGDYEDHSTFENIIDFKAKQVSAGGEHTVVIDVNDIVWSFGKGDDGELGLFSEKSRNTPHQVTINRRSFKAKQVSAGYEHTIAIDLDDNVWGFGNNQDGQLGLDGDIDDLENKFIPTQLENFKAKQVSAGERHTILIDLNDNVWSFGSSSEGQLGLGDGEFHITTPTQVFFNNKPFKAKQVSTRSTHTVVIDLNDNVWAFGENDSGQLGLGDNINRDEPTMIENLKAKEVSVGSGFTLIIDLDDNVWSFGSNSDGQLGLGNNDDQHTPQQVMLGKKPFKAQQISAGAFHTVVIDLGNNIWVCGDNESGELGLGDIDKTRNKLTLVDYFKAKQVSAGHTHTMMIGTLVR